MENLIPNRNGATPLPTAVEVAVAKTEPSRTPITDRTVEVLHKPVGQKIFPKEINTRHPITDEPRLLDWLLFEPIPTEAVEQWETLRSQSKEKFPDAEFPASPDGLKYRPMTGPTAPATIEEFELLQKAEAEVKSVQEAMKPFSLSNVAQRWRAERDQQAAAIHAGDTPAGLLPTREAIHADSLARLTAFNARLAQLTQEFLPTVGAVLERFEQTVTAFMRRTEIRDRELCAIIGVEYAASVEFKAAAMILIKYSAVNRLPKSPSAHVTPSSILGGIVEL